MTTEQIVPSEDLVREALMEVIDPEIGVNIVDLGMVYGVDVSTEGNVKITMTLTTPMCPLSEYIDAAVKEALAPLPAIGEVDVNLVWVPAWNPSMMSEDAKLELGFW
jgi:metal-sulfur cluster biosynthetic enzyme